MMKRYMIAAILLLALFPVSAQTGKWTRTEQDDVFTYSDGVVSFRMINIPGGNFLMGATEEQGTDARLDERPVHRVTVKTFALGETEVTSDLWEAVMGEKRGAPGQAVDGLTYDDCTRFISRLSELTGVVFRLPTEAEWEYAARGGELSKNSRYSGSDDLSAVASRNPDKTVKTAAPNELGLYDMSGNVPEVCSDWYSPNYYYIAGPWENPAGPRDGGAKVVRGGGQDTPEDECRVSKRRALDERGAGLRLAKVELKSFFKHGNWERRVVDGDLVFSNGSLTFTMKRVEGGSFMMGQSTDPKILQDELNAHKVTVSTYYIGETEVTRELWMNFMGENQTYVGVATEKYAGDLRCPAERVSYESITTFIQRLSKATGVQFRLPTEAEWEFAAKGGNKSAGYVYSGTNKFQNGKLDPIPVYDCVKNELGIYGMSGNVSEYCLDFLSPYRSEDQVDPTGPETGDKHVVKGGSYMNDAHNKEGHIPSKRGAASKYGTGFRLGLSIKDIP